MRDPYTRQRLLCAALLALAGLAGGAHADILHMKNGETMEGRVRIEARGYRIDTGRAEVLIGFDRVERLERRPLPEEAYPRRAAAVEPDEPEANFLLGLWCKEHGLEEKAKLHFERVFEILPDHEGAREAAGYIRDGKRWVTPREYYRERGYVRYRGEWLKPETAETRREEDRRRYAEAEAEKLFRAVRIQPQALDFPASVERLGSFGEYAMPILFRYATDSDPEARSLAIAGLDRVGGDAARALLVRRASRERNLILLRAIARSLRNNPERQKILNALFNDLLRTENRTRIERLTYVLWVIGEKGLIPRLIEMAEFTRDIEVDAGVQQHGGPDGEDAPGDDPAGEAEPNADPGEDENEKDGNDKPASDRIGFLPEKEELHVYPAAIALARITGESFGTDRKAWAAWWERVGESWRFPAPVFPRSRKGGRSFGGAPDPEEVFAPKTD